MSVNKVLSATSFCIEIESGTDKIGAKIYKKKTFSGVKPTTAPQNVFDVVEAINEILSVDASDNYLNESSKLVNS